MNERRADDRLVLIFDGHCGFCSWSAELVGRIDRHGRVRLVACQEGEMPAQLGVSREECEQAAWAVAPDGSRYRGAAAIDAALDFVLGTSVLRFLYGVRPIRWLQDRIYDWFVANRGRLPGMRPYCQQYPGRCEGRGSS